MTGRAIITALLVASVASGQTADPSATPESFELPRVLTLQAALQIFRQRGLDLMIADAAVQSAAGDVRIARAVPNLALNLGFGKSLDCSEGPCKFLPDPVLAAGLSDQSALGATLVGKVRLRTNVAEAALAAAKMSRTDAQRTLESQVKQQFEQVLVAQDALSFAREVQKGTTRMLELTATRYRAGAISEADLARVETTKLEADQAVNVAEQTVRLAQVAVALLLGMRSEIPEFVAEQPELLRYFVPPPLADISAKSLLADALAHRPDLQALRFQRARAEAAVSLAKRLRVPDFALSLQYTQQGNGGTGSITPPTFTFGLSTPLPIFYQQQGEVQKAEADYRTQLLLFAKLESQVTSDVESALAGFVASQRLATRMDGRLLESAKRARDLVSLQYEKGAASLLEFLDAQRTYITIALERLQIVGNYWTSVFKLEQAVGREFSP